MPKEACLNPQKYIYINKKCRINERLSTTRPEFSQPNGRLPRGKGREICTSADFAKPRICLPGRLSSQVPSQCAHTHAPTISLPSSLIREKGFLVLARTHGFGCLPFSYLCRCFLSQVGFARLSVCNFVILWPACLCCNKVLKERIGAFSASKD